jgi:hypothetical protein
VTLGRPAYETVDVLEEAIGDWNIYYQWGYEVMPPTSGQIPNLLKVGLKSATENFPYDKNLGYFIARTRLTELEQWISDSERLADEGYLDPISEIKATNILAIRLAADGDEVFLMSVSRLREGFRGYGIGKSMYLISMNLIYPSWMTMDLGGTSRMALRVWESLYNDPLVECIGTGQYRAGVERKICRFKFDSKAEKSLNIQQVDSLEFRHQKG